MLHTLFFLHVANTCISPENEKDEKDCKKVEKMAYNIFLILIVNYIMN